MRYKDIRDRKVPCITFDIPLKLKFALAMKWSDSENFKMIVKNMNEDVSKVVTKFVFELVGIKPIDRDGNLNMKDFEQFMYDVIKQAKNKIYITLSLNSTNQPNQKVFNKLMTDKIYKFIKQHQNEKNEK